MPPPNGIEKEVPSGRRKTGGGSVERVEETGQTTHRRSCLAVLDAAYREAELEETLVSPWPPVPYLRHKTQSKIRYRVTDSS